MEKIIELKEYSDKKQNCKQPKLYEKQNQRILQIR